VGAGDNKGAGQSFNTGMTPDEARRQWSEMTRDKDTLKSLQDATHPDHKTNKAKQTRLFQIMHPEK
jgi:hypothetical protein